MSEPLNPEVAMLNAALELPVEQRTAYLDEACAGDAALRRQVEALLQAHEQALNFMEEPPTVLGFKRSEMAGTPLIEKPGDRIDRRRFCLERSVDLNTPVWTPVGPELRGQGGVVSLNDAIPGTVSQAFYRLRSVAE